MELVNRAFDLRRAHVRQVFDHIREVFAKLWLFSRYRLEKATENTAGVCSCLVGRVEPGALLILGETVHTLLLLPARFRHPVPGLCVLDVDLKLPLRALRPVGILCALVRLLLCPLPRLGRFLAKPVPLLEIGNASALRNDARRDAGQPA